MQYIYIYCEYIAIITVYQIENFGGHKMKKFKLSIVFMLVLCLLFNSLTIAYADVSTKNALPPAEVNIPNDSQINDNQLYVTEPGDIDGGGHLCDYHSEYHIVSASEAYGGNVTVNLFWLGLAALCPYSLALDIYGIFAGDLAIFTPLEGDKIITTWGISYNPINDSYDFVCRNYVYRPTWNGGQTLVHQDYFHENYPWYSRNYSLYKENCPHK